MCEPKPLAYRTTNWPEYNAALARRGSLLIWFDPETQWLAAPTGKCGRQPVFTDAAIQAWLTRKALFGLPLRQTTGMEARLLEPAGLDSSVPDFSTLCRRQKSLTVHIPHRPGTGALHLLIDSTGVKAAGDGAWLARKHGPPQPRDWRKVHLGIDAETPEIRAIEVTGSRIGERVMSRDFDRQVAELQIRAAILNRFAALGTPLTQPAGQVCPREGEVRPSADLRNKAAQGENVAATTAAGRQTALALQRAGLFIVAIPRNGTPLGNVI